MQKWNSILLFYEIFVLQKTVQVSCLTCAFPLPAAAIAPTRAPDLFECAYAADGFILWENVNNGQVDCLRDGSDETAESFKLRPGQLALKFSEMWSRNLKRLNMVCTPQVSFPTSVDR